MTYGRIWSSDCDHVGGAGALEAQAGFPVDELCRNERLVQNAEMLLGATMAHVIVVASLRRKVLCAVPALLKFRFSSLGRPHRADR